MKDSKTRLARAVALLLAGLMIFSTLFGALMTFVSAAEERDSILATARGLTVDTLNKSGTLSLSLRLPFLPAELEEGVKTAASFEILENENLDENKKDSEPTVPVWRTSSSTRLSVSAGTNSCTITISNIYYDARYGNYRYFTLRNIVLDPGGSGTERTALKDVDIIVSVPREYFKGEILDDDSSGGSSGGSSSGSSSDDDEDYTYTSNVVFESAAITRGGTKVDSIDKDSAPFDLEVTYTDTGLRDAELSNLRGTSIDVFFTPGGSFTTTGTTRGTIRLVTNTRSRYPRFKVSFSNVTYTGVGNEAAFQVYYLFSYMDDPVKGEGTAFLSEAKPDEEDDDDDDKLGLAVPKVIIDNYSYGKETIVAGQEFDLNFSLRNTSGELPLDNIVITLTPAANEAADKGPGLLVASSSNTLYLPMLDAGASAPYTVAFQARPDAEVTSHIVQIKFSYEYVDTVKKSRETAEMTESIAIPVSQLDRFSVDPIAEPAYGELGSEAYLPVSLVNLGKSTTYNIALSIRCDNPAVTAPTERSDNLKPGESDTVDLMLTSTEAGEFTGDVVVEYEDENGNAKELTTPFSYFVEEPWMPPPDDTLPPDMDLEQPAPGPSVLSIVLCVIGGLAVAVPIALYFIKRVKARASEDFDEAF